MAQREIVTRTERIWIEDGIVRCVVLATATHTLEDAEVNARTVVELAEGRKLPMLLDTRDSRGLDRDARLFYVRPEAAEQVSALAMLIDSQIGRMFGNFYTNVHRPPFPLRLFNTESDAVAWLKAQVV
ncbi:DUF7793 family protein [Nannocystis bainbridge]|uniref:DUF7793 domain-containing protein n=1 Tax=Nannocystis bainbridge TaxID=2995303 RepID=A0ABT5DQH6_9BACT|nr:STAS/SEC14 domain-containing protein [Nannocystis bainbridge]MDC0715849.1 hypothetical protein [Nannocystis bainbridge]